MTLRFPARAVLARLAVFVVAAAASGCGGSGDAVDEEYEDGMRDVAADVRAASAATADLPSTATARQRSAAIGDQRTEMTEAVERMQQLDPPADVEEPHEDLQTALEDYIALLGKLDQAGGDPKREGAVIAEISDGRVVERLQAASERLESAGYDFGGGKADGG